MTLPRISVGAIMFGLAVVAIDCVVYRSLLARPDSLQDGLWLVVLGTLPMANVSTLVVASAIRGRAEARGPRVGFACGACLAMLASIFGMRPALEGIEMILTSTGLVGWLMGSPIRQAVTMFGIVIGLPLLVQGAAGLIGGWAGRRVGARRPPGLESARSPGRFRLAALASIVILASAPALAVEGYLRKEVDPKLTRIEVGREAVVDFHQSRYPGRLPKNSRIRTLEGVRVRVEADREPYQIELMMIQVGTAKPMEKTSHDLRQVEVKLLDGPRAGESTTMYHCFLRLLP